jgi:hypothetical protein
MKTGLITPVTNIDADVHACKEHLMAEFSEVAEAWNGWDSKEPKTTAHLVEELVDLATACMTLADRIEKDSEIPQLVNNTLLMVGAKNYTRGYHNKPMI